ncbi:hypothetical protein CRM22_002472 [Opisthorchis felineus]|uniref:Uncharacterized protein n=1 Tax=Opisthorchis felineus TaxID=147828 RepID=A0A4S2M5X0_OPIFE|nr:hypothetical protein CRM22_002472 [Opisthorchis felineus]
MRAHNKVRLAELQLNSDDDCKGPAKEAVAECVMLPPEIVYDRVREILKDLLGRELMVARAVLDDLFKKLKPLQDDADSLYSLSVNFQNCHVALSQMNHTSDMNFVSTMERVLRTLSEGARRNWARLSDTMDNLGKQIQFSDLCIFVSPEARIARCRYGMIAVSSEELHLPQTQQHRVGNERRHNLFTVQKETYGLCPLCDTGCRHGLACCQKFKTCQRRQGGVW